MGEQDSEPVRRSRSADRARETDKMDARRRYHLLKDKSALEVLQVLISCWPACLAR